MSNSNEYLEMRQAMMPTYAPSETVFTKGKGSYLFTEDGEKYLDFFAGIAVNCLGHCHPQLVHALQEQASQLWHVSNALRVSSGEELSKKLTQLSGLDKVFFTNSGTESVECGLKMMRRHHFDQGQAHRNRIIGTNASFHGRSYAAICAAGNPLHTKGFIREDEAFDHVPFNDLAAMQALVNENTAGIIVETVQGEGGIHVADKDYVTGLRALCDKHDILLMFDEVQCGIARTGTMFAFEQYGVQPDIISLAKGLGGGFPVGACVAKSALADKMVVGTHGSTYGGNPLAMSVANTVIDIVSQGDFLQHVKNISVLLMQSLNDIKAEFPSVIKDVRGLGLMLGIECIPENANADLVSLMRKHKLLVTKAGNNVVRLLPPLNIEQKQVSEATDRIRQALSDYLAQ